eukprot:TRINITY_DN34857_c0_g1_i1.p1 TRINITY_DN34857_c0_g1~~TRINITY_DN34857_c0_g1_i1.p1  ORF type:complete len:222 (+),score=38.39 TRINITY_DN34857_c0_g1_i1:45-668(+)
MSRSASRPTNSGTLEINVGGVIYETTPGRVTSEASQLKTMLTERSYLDKEGRVFIDRDGELFRYVLAYLRDRTTPLPDDLFTLKKLRNEAVFYDLTAMVGYIEKKLSLVSSERNPRIIEIKEYTLETPTGVPEILCTPLPAVLEPLYLTFDAIPVSKYGKDSSRLNTVKHAESVPQIAGILHEQAGYRTIGFSNGAVLMQRNDYASA